MINFTQTMYLNNTSETVLSEGRKHLLENLRQIKYQKQTQFKENVPTKIPAKVYFKPHDKQELFPEGFTSILELDKKILLSVDHIDPLVECYQTNKWLASVIESENVLKSLSEMFKLETANSFVKLVKYYDRKYITIRSTKYYELNDCAYMAAKQNKENLVYKFIELAKINQEKINYNKIASGAAKYGNLSLLENLLNRAKVDCENFSINYDMIVIGAIKGTNEKIFDIFFNLATSSTNHKWDEDEIVRYASGVDKIQFYDKIAEAFPGEHGCYLKAGKSGNWEILKKILRIYITINDKKLISAIINGKNPTVLVNVLETFPYLFFRKATPVLQALYKNKFDIADVIFDMVKSECDSNGLTKIATEAARKENYSLLQKVLSMTQLLSYDNILYDIIMERKTWGYFDLIYNSAPIDYNWDFNRLAGAAIATLNLRLLKDIFGKGALTNYVFGSSLACSAVNIFRLPSDDSFKFKEILLFLVSSTSNVDFNLLLRNTIGTHNIDYLITTLEVAPTDYDWDYQRLAETATKVQAYEIHKLIVETASLHRQD
jgi:hypothetical protein